MTNETRQLCTFHLDDLYLGIDVLDVQEILQGQSMAPVPLAPAVVCGLINLRGHIITALDLRHLLGRPAAENRAALTNVVVSSAADTLSFVVDDIGDVQEVDAEAFEPVPQNLDADVRLLLDGVYKLDHDLLLMLNTDKAAQAALGGSAEE